MDTNTVTVNGTETAVPGGAVAYKYNDPTEDARWIYDEAEARRIAVEDPSLIEWVPVAGRVSVNDILNGKLPADATGVRWTDTDWTECRGHLQNWWGAATPSGEPVGVVLTGDVQCDACAERDRNNAGTTLA